MLVLLSAALLALSACRTPSVELPEADALIDSAVAEHVVPGAVLCVVKGGKVVYEKAYGMRQVVPEEEAMTVETVFDLASLSKVVGTGMTAMSLVEEGLLDLDAPVNRYLPEYEGDATIRHLMTHVSGLPAYATWSVLIKDEPDATPERRKAILRDYVCHCRRLSAPGEECRYSCLNFITLQYVMEAITGRRLDVLAAERVFAPLGMVHTGYHECPAGGYEAPCGLLRDVEKGSESYEKLIAPTELQADGACLRGVVHDPLAREMNNGVSGNAGVFASAGDLALLAEWMLNVLHDRKTVKGPFGKQTLELMMTIPAGYEAFGRALAWDVCSDYSACRGSLTSAGTVCHTGYTGTSMVVDAENDVAIILLTNRVHPHDVGGVNTLRRQVADAVMQKIK